MGNKPPMTLAEVELQIRILERRQARLSTCGYDEKANQLQTEIATLYKIRAEMCDNWQKEKQNGC